MIDLTMDWLNILYNTLWILGLAALLATFSLAHWRASWQGASLRRALSEPGFRLAVAAEIALFALGLTLLVEPWWYKIGWVGIMAFSLWEGIAAWRRWPGKTKGELSGAETQ
jgi:hypothetical protein